MLSFSLVAEALTGLIYLRPSPFGRKISYLEGTLVQTELPMEPASSTDASCFSNAVAIGTALVPELLFSMGMVIYCTCVFPKIRS